MKMPRLLPLVAVAASGVLAINLLENGPGIIGAARSFAEGVSGQHAPAHPGSALPSNATVAPSSADPNQSTAASPAPICAQSAADIAR